MLNRPAWLLRVEEAGLLIAAILLYRRMHFSWLMFALLFLVPDISMLGYCFNVRAGAALYNMGHFILVPLALFSFAYAAGRPFWMAVAIIWFSHIALDRMLGYGLKYPTAFKDTHLQHF